MRRILRFAFCVGLLGLACCHPAPAGPSVAPPPLPPGTAVILSAAEAEAGRKLYVNKCARCHKFYDPAKYRAAEWDGWMRKMSRKAKLKPAQEAPLRRYLDAYRVVGTTSTSGAATSNP